MTGHIFLLRRTSFVCSRDFVHYLFSVYVDRDIILSENLFFLKCVIALLRTGASCSKTSYFYCCFFSVNVGCR